MKYLSEDQLRQLRAFDAPTIYNAIDRLHVRPAVEGFMLPGMSLRTHLSEPMIGYAVTAKVSAAYQISDAPARLEAYYQTVLDVPAPTIAVIQDIDETPIGSFWGEVQATSHKALGCIGTITKGGVRDLTECDQLGFSLFSTEVMVARGYTHIEAYHCPVSILGLTVHPGDLLFADQHGVVLIPEEVTDQLVDTCKKVIYSELAVLEPARKAIQDGIKPTAAQLAAWRREMKSR